MDPVVHWMLAGTIVVLCCIGWFLKWVDLKHR